MARAVRSGDRYNQQSHNTHLSVETDSWHKLAVTVRNFLYNPYTAIPISQSIQYSATNGWNGLGNPLIRDSHNSLECHAAGPPWSIQLSNLTNTNLIDLAVSGAAVDNNIIHTGPLDFVGQTEAFLNHVVSSPPKGPTKVKWDKEDSLFTVTFGTNDVTNSFLKTPTPNNSSLTTLYTKTLTSYFRSVEKLYEAGARRFIFNNVIPFDRAEIGISLGLEGQERLKDSILTFNEILQQKAEVFCSSKEDLNTCLVFDTHKIFTILMNHHTHFGFSIPSQSCQKYHYYRNCILDSNELNGIGSYGCLGPISAYIWKDNLHPTYMADRYWSLEIIAALSEDMSIKKLEVL